MKEDSLGFECIKDEGIYYEPVMNGSNSRGKVHNFHFQYILHKVGCRQHMYTYMEEIAYIVITGEL